MADALAHLLFVRALVQSYVFALKACLNRFISSGVRDRKYRSQVLRLSREIKSPVPDAFCRIVIMP
jgi:hypothetical protein